MPRARGRSPPLQEHVLPANEAPGQGIHVAGESSSAKWMGNGCGMELVIRDSAEIPWLQCIVIPVYVSRAPVDVDTAS